ncbi:hypothetical protein MTR_4g129390 [Medicago truncatula]|uniref:Uncharacterized protein n=1 Tax=Medicago truncatula TaxID=3880 RepID=G7JEB3_MEDTR|nr:hypothetical protein MTR_4g129390 [Medicago truncatula]
MGLNDEILDFEGRRPIRSPFYGSDGPEIFSDFLGSFRAIRSSSLKTRFLTKNR